MSQPDLGSVTVFVKVVELESFTAAATALGVPKSSVSRTVAGLEESLGVRLLQRTSRKLSLTDVGRAFYERVRDPLRSVLDAMSEATDSEGEPRGTIRFTAPPDMGSGLLAAPIAEFARTYPQITIDITLTARIVDLVQERFDLALRAVDKLDDSSLVARRLSSARVGMYASREYIKRRGRPKSLEDLANHKFIVFRGRDGRKTLHLEGPDGPEDVEVRGPIAVDDVGFVRLAVLEGAGIGLMPLVACGDEVERVLPEYSTLGGTLFLVMPSGRHLPARVTLFRDFLIEKLKDVFLRRMR